MSNTEDKLESKQKDYTNDIEILFQQLEKQELSFENALEALFLLEKSCRYDNDLKNLIKIALRIINFCYESIQWKELLNSIILINKKRLQHKNVIIAIVHRCIELLELTPSLDIKMQLLETLLLVCEGKIYIEAEDAKLHLQLALLYETEKGDVQKACELIQDIHVETFGSLTKLEKATYILQQIRLNLVAKNYIRAMIQSRKMNRKILNEEGFEYIKMQYFLMVIELYKLSTHDRDPWEISQAYFHIYDTKVIHDENAIQKNKYLESCVIFLILSKFTNHVNDMMHRLLLALDKTKDTSSLAYRLLTLFTTQEIVSFSFIGRTEVEQNECMTQFAVELGMVWIDLLNQRIIEHNLRVLSKSYTRIRLDRISEMLELSKDIVEERLADLTSQGDIYVKINRPQGIVTFQKPRAAEEVLSGWSSDLNQLVSLMESTCHLIRRENMVHKMN